MQSDHSETKILCIEDEDVLLEELEEELSSRGYSVLTAENGDAAEAILAKVTPDIVLCDVMMPGRNGFELLRDLRAGGKLSEKTAFIYLTALSDREPHLDGLRAGADDYLTKPVDLDLLHLKIENIVAFARRQRAETPAGAPVPEVKMSKREEEVLGLLGEGERTGGIATRLGISEHTVSQYIKELYKKLGINNRADAARMAIRMGLSGSGRN